MASYPNQLLYSINKKIEGDDIFIMLKWEDYTNAAKNLSPAALKLYMYLAKNQDGYKFYFSSTDYCKTFELTDRTFRNARDELFDKGYLKKGKGNFVYFNTQPIYKETCESLKNELRNLFNILNEKDEDKKIELSNEISKAHLKTLQEEDENACMAEYKRLIELAKILVDEVSSAEFNGLL